MKKLKTTGVLLSAPKTPTPVRGRTELQKTGVDAHLLVGLKAALLSFYHSRVPEIPINPI